MAEAVTSGASAHIYPFPSPLSEPAPRVHWRRGRYPRGVVSFNTARYRRDARAHAEQAERGERVQFLRGLLETWAHGVSVWQAELDELLGQQPANKSFQRQTLGGVK